ncbi:Ktr system potassium uptake protein B [compost metagenome]
MTAARAIRRKGLQPNASQLIVLGYLSFVLLGAFLLMLPVSHVPGPKAGIDDLFFATSAVTTTGLAPGDVVDRYSPFGQGVLMLLIQLGGLGYMSLFTLTMLLIGQRISLRDRLNIQEGLEQPGMAGLVRFVLHIVGFSVAVQLVSGFFLVWTMVPEFGWSKGLVMTLFHVVGAFNNAGFPFLPEGAIHWQRNAEVLLVLAMTTVIGGLGFNVNQELVRRYLFRRAPRQRWNVLIGIVLGLTAALLAIATAVIWYFEARNPKTLGPLPLHLQAANAFFMAVQPRSCGFNSVEVGAMARPSLLLMLALMFIGAGPGSTGSGIKLTTVAVTAAGVKGVLQGRQEIALDWFRRRLDERLVRKAFAVVLLSLAVVAFSTLLLASIEPLPFLPILFEVLSAFGNAGLSMGITGLLGTPSKLILILTMLIGRVGMITVMLSLFPSRRRSAIRYVEEPLLIG